MHMWSIFRHKQTTCLYIEGTVELHDLSFLIWIIEEEILEAKTECYEKDKVKSPLFFRSFYDDFQSLF